MAQDKQPLDHIGGTASCWVPIGRERERRRWGRGGGAVIVVELVDVAVIGLVMWWGRAAGLSFVSPIMDVT